MTKRIISVVMVLVLILSLGIPSFAAATTQKITVTAEKTAIREKASATAKQLASAKKGQSFTSVSSTKSFWKIQFKQNSKTYTGYIAKKDARVATKTTTANTAPKSTSWTKIYSDYLSEFKFEKVLDGNGEPMGSGWVFIDLDVMDEGKTVKEGRFQCYDIEFRNLKEYEYPVLIINQRSESWYYGNLVAHIIKNGKVVTMINGGSPFFTDFDGQPGSIKPRGTLMAKFSMLIDNSPDKSDPKAMQKVLDWLAKQK